MTRTSTLRTSLALLLPVAVAWACSDVNRVPRNQWDTDNDGVADDLGKGFDLDGDGVLDGFDCSGDGTFDGPGVDTNDDGVPDALGFDTDGDGLVDAIDTDGDCQPDLYSSLVHGEGNGTGSGGTPSTDGGPVGSGGNDSTGSGGTTSPTGPRPLPEGWSGYLTYRVSDSTTDAIYQEWKTNHVESCGDGTSRVVRPEENNDTVSEGIAYGMLLAVGHDDKALFDQLWGFFKKHAQSQLLPWKMSGCNGVQDQNNATDAELDAAMALIQAGCRWGDAPYKQDAASLLGAVISQLLGQRNGYSNLKPARDWMPASCLNASYVAPGYYRAFAGVDTANAAAWNKLATDAYPLLNGVANSSTGLVPDWSDASEGSCGSGRPLNYTYDAARTPWRVATDYLWYGTPEAKTFNDRITNWLDSTPSGITGVRDGYQLNGTLVGQYVNAAFTGGFATGAFTHSQELADKFGQALNNVRGNNYFGRSLKGLYTLLATGRFAKSCY